MCPLLWDRTDQRSPRRNDGITSTFRKQKSPRAADNNIIRQGRIQQLWWEGEVHNISKILLSDMCNVLNLPARHLSDLPGLPLSHTKSPTKYYKKVFKIPFFSFSPLSPTQQCRGRTKMNNFKFQTEGTKHGWGWGGGVIRVKV